MNPTILRKVRAVRRRLMWLAWWRLALRTTGWAALALALWLLTTRLVPLRIEARQAAAAIGGVAALAWLIGAWRARPRLHEAAVRADAALGLKERLSTALALRNPRTEPERAVLADAAAHAARLRPSEAFPLRAGREARWALTPLAALAAIYLFMPQLNLFAKQQRTTRQKAMAVAVQQQSAQQLEAIADQVRAANESQRVPDQARVLDREIEALARQLEAGKLTPEHALARTDNLKEKLAARRAELEKQLDLPSQLKSQGEGRQTGEMARQLEKGNFSRAAKELEALKQKLKDNKLSAGEKQQLQEELKALAAKLGKESKLGQALGEACDKLAEGQDLAALGGFEAAQSEMLDMDAMLKELAQLQSVDYDLDAFKEACKGKPGACASCGKACDGALCGECAAAGKQPWREGDSRKQSDGMGGPGIGRGQVADKKENPFELEKGRIKGDLDPGRIIARMKVEGTQQAGELTTEYEALRMEYSQQAEDAVQKSPLPAEYRSLVRNYFDAIKQGKSEPATAQPQGAAQPNAAVPAAPPASSTTAAPPNTAKP